MAINLKLMDYINNKIYDCNYYSIFEIWVFKKNKLKFEIVEWLVSSQVVKQFFQLCLVVIGNMAYIMSIFWVYWGILGHNIWSSFKAIRWKAYFYLAYYRIGSMLIKSTLLHTFDSLFHDGYINSATDWEIYIKIRYCD